MAGRRLFAWRPAGLWLVLTLTASAPSVVWAQTAQITQAAPAIRTLAPGITASFGAGFGVQSCCPDELLGDMTGSVQVPLGPRWSVEGQFQVPTTTTSTVDFGGIPNPYFVLSGYRNTTQRDFSGGGSVLYRLVAGNRVSAFVGGGMTVRHRVNTYENTKVCVAIVPGSCYYLDQEPRNYGTTSDSWSPQASAGIDVAVTKLVTLFGAVRIDDAVTPYGGVRIAITTRPAAPLTAPDVRVRATNGSQYRGKLVSLTATEVVFKESGRNVVLPIADVQRVEKRTHRVRNGLIAGAILGYVSGYLLSCGGGDENDCWPEVGLVGAGIGTAAGALAGWSFNRRAARDGRDVLYARSGHGPATLQFAPIVSPRRAGLGMLLRW